MERRNFIKNISLGAAAAIISGEVVSGERNNLKNIIEALEEISKDTVVILPIHPRTKLKINSFIVIICKVEDGTWNLKVWDCRRDSTFLCLVCIILAGISSGQETCF